LVILHKIPASPPFSLHQERINPLVLKESDAHKINLIPSSLSSQQKK
jgi:hypothetical protein